MAKLLNFRAVLVTAFMLLGAPAMAEWALDEQQSTVQFMSVKNASVAELHHFKAISGGISETGAAEVKIDLDSVETLVPIRNQRMRELFFETVRFPTASLAAEVPESLTQLSAGESRDTNIEVDVSLHGETASYSAQVLVTALVDGALQVVLSEPILVQAGDFGLAKGVEMLREVAGLKSISTAVPVTATLVFTPAS